jgi:hypothetical protein
MRVQRGKQQGPIDDEVRALIAIVRPILVGLLSNLKGSIAKSGGGRNKISLELFARAHMEGDGDAGICFEHAVHDAMARGDPMVMERIADALKKCRVPGADPQSILFGVEKDGALQIIDTAKKALTDDSLLLHGRQGAPIRLKKHIDGVVLAFRSPAAREILPPSIRGLWKADLMVGTDQDKWVGTTVKNSARKLQDGDGLRIGIYPSRQGETDRVRKDSSKNLVLCPLEYDEDFVQCYYEAFDIVRAFCRAGGSMPKEVVLPRPPARRVAQMLVERRKFPVVEVLEALAVFEQPDLISASEASVSAPSLQGDSQQEMIFSPRPQRRIRFK